MYDFNIDHNEVRRLVREAELMRAESIANLLRKVWQGIASAGATVVNLARTWNQRRKFNLSIPAAHR